MKLLILTQKIDKEDPILGFFHNWVLKLSEKFNNIVVICLSKGDFDLPKNVQVLSLGKEKSKNKIKYIFNFYKYIWNEQKNYDAVFVHMNQEYVLLGVLFWKMLGKKIYLWRNHSKGNVLTKLAILFSDKVFCTSGQAFTAQFKKTVLMPVGIDVSRFTDDSVQIVERKNKILSLGRISPIKNIHLMLGVAEILKGKNVNFILDIFGDPVNPEDFKYKDNLIKEHKDIVDSGVVNFFGAVPNYKTPEIYQSHGIFLNLTPSGSFDKTILEAAASGCVPFIYAEIGNNLGGVHIPDLNLQKIADSLDAWFKTSDERKNEIRKRFKDFVFQSHSLNALIEKLYVQISG